MSDGISLGLSRLTLLNGGVHSASRTLPSLCGDSSATASLDQISHSNNSMVHPKDLSGNQVPSLPDTPSGSNSVHLDISPTLLTHLLRQTSGKAKSSSTVSDHLPNGGSKEVIKIIRTDLPYQQTNDSVDYSTRPINSLEELMKILPEDLYSLLRSRKNQNSRLKLLREVPLEKIPTSDLDQLKVEFSKPVELSPTQPIEIEYIPGNPLPDKVSIYDLVRYRPPPTWEAIFQTTLPDLKNISTQVERNEVEFGFDTIVPKRHNIFKAFELTPLDKVSVVIIGQDPYVQVMHTGDPIAQGLAFSVPKDYRLNSPAARSVQNILQVVSNTIEGWRNAGHGCLDHWASQGVLLLNMALTSIKGVSNHHRTIWSGFIEKVCRSIITVNPKVIFVLWGGDAQKISNTLGGKVSQIKGPHPVARDGSFMKIDHFQLINYALFKHGKPLIDWNLEPSSVTGFPPATGIDSMGGIIRKGSNNHFGNLGQNSFEQRSLIGSPVGSVFPTPQGFSPGQVFSPPQGFQQNPTMSFIASPGLSFGKSPLGTPTPRTDGSFDLSYPNTPINHSSNNPSYHVPQVNRPSPIHPGQIPLILSSSNSINPIGSPNGINPMVSPHRNGQLNGMISPPMSPPPQFFAPNLSGSYISGANMSSPVVGPNLRTSGPVSIGCQPETLKGSWGPILSQSPGQGSGSAPGFNLTPKLNPLQNQMMTQSSNQSTIPSGLSNTPRDNMSGKTLSFII